MFEELFGELTLRHILVSLLIFAAFIGFAWLFRSLVVRFAHKLAGKTSTGLDDAIVSAVSKPIVAIIVLAGLYLSVLSLPLEPVPALYFSRAMSTVLSLLGIYSGVAFLDAVIRWYVREVLPRHKETGLNRRILQVFRVGLIMVAVLVAVLISLEIWGIDSASITNWLGEHGWRIALIIVLSLVLTIIVGEFVPRVVVTTLSRRTGETDDEIRKRGATLSRVLVGTGQIAVLLIAVFMLLSELQINIAPILAGVGVAGIAIGFGAQSLVKDIVAGLFIILENQYRVGDVVRIADVAGLVEDINLRRTVLRNLDGIVHVVPNGETRVASNFTKEWSRVNMNVSVAYGEDLDHVISVINRVGKELAEDSQWAPLILTPPQALRVDNLGNSGIEIKILGDTKPIRQWDVMGELRKRLKRAFDEEGIEIPWPHTKVYFGNSLSWDSPGSPMGRDNRP
jgi:small conductance mechanosensitive channel